VVRPRNKIRDLSGLLRWALHLPNPTLFISGCLVRNWTRPAAPSHETRLPSPHSWPSIPHPCFGRALAQNVRMYFTLSAWAYNLPEYSFFKSSLICKFFQGHEIGDEEAFTLYSRPSIQTAWCSRNDTFNHVLGGNVSSGGHPSAVPLGPNCRTALWYTYTIGPKNTCCCQP
jgi:hypothetical protein